LKTRPSKFYNLKKLKIKKKKKEKEKVHSWDIPGLYSKKLVVFLSKKLGSISFSKPQQIFEIKNWN
jgi:hypothetical protein